MVGGVKAWLAMRPAQRAAAAPPCPAPLVPSAAARIASGGRRGVAGDAYTLPRLLGLGDRAARAGPNQTAAPTTAAASTPQQYKLHLNTVQNKKIQIS